LNDWYDEIGKGYIDLRIPDARIGALIESALGDCTSIVNIGAGTGAYEPEEKEVYALEPSTLMLQQYKGTGTRIQGTAEANPLADKSVDASMGILTLHHWGNWQQGLSEMLRVSRDTSVLLTHTPDLFDFWLLDYFPAIREIDQKIFSSIDEIKTAAATEGWQTETISMPVPHDCTDGFLGAYWRRPKAYFRPEVRRSISTFNLLDKNLVQETLNRLHNDIESGTWHDRYGRVMELTELNLGYRILKMTPLD
jgi:SAM-dependent methyltransferase